MTDRQTDRQMVRRIPDEDGGGDEEGDEEGDLLPRLWRQQEDQGVDVGGQHHGYHQAHCVERRLASQCHAQLGKRHVVQRVVVHLQYHVDQNGFSVLLSICNIAWTSIIIIIAFKGAIREFSVSSLRRELSATRTLKWPVRNRVQITCNISKARHLQHAVLRATWYERTAQLLSMTELKLHLFELYYTG